LLLQFTEARKHGRFWRGCRDVKIIHTRSAATEPRRFAKQDTEEDVTRPACLRGVGEFDSEVGPMLELMHSAPDQAAVMPLDVRESAAWFATERPSVRCPVDTWRQIVTPRFGRSDNWQRLKRSTFRENL
jgi:hypothetical protein